MFLIILKIIEKDKMSVIKRAASFTSILKVLPALILPVVFSKPDYVGVVYLPTLVVSILLLMMFGLSQNANVYKHNGWTLASTSGALFVE